MFKGEVVVPGAIRGSYAWSIANGRAFEISVRDPETGYRHHRGTFCGVWCRSPKRALEAARKRYAGCWVEGLEVEVLRHLPGSTGCLKQSAQGSRGSDEVRIV